MKDKFKASRLPHRMKGNTCGGVKAGIWEIQQGWKYSLLYFSPDPVLNQPSQTASSFTNGSSLHPISAFYSYSSWLFFKTDWLLSYSQLFSYTFTPKQTYYSLILLSIPQCSWIFCNSMPLLIAPLLLPIFQIRMNLLYLFFTICSVRVSSMSLEILDHLSPYSSISSKRRISSQGVQWPRLTRGFK